MTEELLVPFYTEIHETSRDVKIIGGPHRFKTAYCLKKTFDLESDESKIAHYLIEEYNGYDFIDIAEERTEKVKYIFSIFDKKLYDLYNTEDSVLDGLENINEERSPLHISKDISKKELLDKEERVLGKLKDISYDKVQENKKLVHFLEKLKKLKREISYIEDIISKLDEILRVKTQSVEKQGTQKL